MKQVIHNKLDVSQVVYEIPHYYNIPQCVADNAFKHFLSRYIIDYRPFIINAIIARTKGKGITYIT